MPGTKIEMYLEDQLMQENRQLAQLPLGGDPMLPRILLHLQEHDAPTSNVIYYCVPIFCASVEAFVTTTVALHGTTLHWTVESMLYS